MQNAFVEQWESFGKSALEAVKELEAISSRIVEKLAEQQFHVVSTALETGVRQFHLVTETKDYKDLLAAQTKLASEYNEKLMLSAKKATEILNDARSDFTSWFEKGLNGAVSANGAKKATPAAAAKKAN